jgi:hypothetical protein
MSDTSRRWPIGITIAFIIVIVVNMVFVGMALRGSDPVVASYNLAPR